MRLRARLYWPEARGPRPEASGFWGMRESRTTVSSVQDQSSELRFSPDSEQPSPLEARTMFFRNNEKSDPPGRRPAVRTVPLLPLRDIIVFPHMVVPLFVGREKSIAALEEAMAPEKDILLAAQKKARTNDPSPEAIFKIGTL